jgi:hypothetical protein
VGYHPSVLKPIAEIDFPSDFISFEDCIVQLSLSRNLPSSGFCPVQIMGNMTNNMTVRRFNVFI